MKDEILTLNKKELIQRLMDGEKLQPADSECGYCIYDETKDESPFRYISETHNTQMVGIWNKTKWKIYKEPVKFWEPENKKEAWFVDIGGCAVRSSAWFTQLDKNIITIGNVFKTKEDAEKYINFKKAEHRLRKAVWELNEGPAPKFKHIGENFTICIDGDSLSIDAWYNLQINPDWLLFKTIELANKLAETHKNDLLIYLHGV